ncbi:heavy-metal-associated domain-containing protein [Methylococcus sp. Mc7]|uniref:heavy-metal-associated domain-containing protein n=1 Tax=Methylococcus sp. Mc7 TaxID=2860258 RepID=UPI001C52D4DC|nr:heavy-metal-associated domain-containing protein [Methylococcus sp. Mc7]QXP82788.1 cation transporter [Methylococcus sp. Mc7]
MSLKKQIILRYSGAGHVRFELPAELCEASARAQIESALRALDGVYRVSLSPGSRKLSVRFDIAVCDLKAIGRRLGQLVDAGVGQAGRVQGAVSVPVGRPFGWLREKAREAGETLAAMKIVARRTMKNSPKLLTPAQERGFIEFFNDVLVLYLIKLHWHLITQHWLRQPLRYRYEWMAVFYMIFLLVRSRRPRNV